MSDERNDERMERQLSTADMVEAAEREGRQETRERTAAPEEGQPVALLPDDQVDSFRSQWNTIQTRFVDDPRTSVEQADSLVAEVMKEIARTFATERQMLEDQWTTGDQVSTEDLRIALQRYRSFFNRLLSI